MDNFQNCDGYINITSSQTYRSYSQQNRRKDKMLYKPRTGVTNDFLSYDGT
jgi:hypothetical protein